MRLSETFDRAREVMLRTELHSLPINPFYVCEKLNILVIPYSEMRTDGLFERIGLDPNDNVDGFCYKDDSNHFVIFYDDARTPKERINFTIAHELGHIVLGHLKNVTMRPRYMTNRRNDPREREADAFAGELIRPPILFVLIGWQLPRHIRAICNITYEAATVCSKQVQILRKKRDHPYYFKDFKFYREQFFDFIYAKQCRRCRHVFIDDSAKFCPICACKFLSWFHERLPLIDPFAAETKGAPVLKYKDYPVNDKMQVMHCLRCDNEDLSPDDRFCKICGAPVYNYCTGQCGDIGSCAHIPDYDQGCGVAFLPSNARFCTSCGCVSAFYYAGLLQHWEKERDDSQNDVLMSISDQPHWNTTPDDDIPF